MQFVGPMNIGVTVVGRVFEDLDGNGKRGRNEPPVPGVVIDSLPHHVGFRGPVTDEDGRFRVETLFAAFVTVEVVPPAGLHPTPGDDGVRHAVLPRHKDFARIRVRPIPLTRTGGVTGGVFLDSNRDRVWQDEERAARGWRVFLDANGDGLRQRSERTTTSNRAGAWSFAGLGAGTYRFGIFGRRRFGLRRPRAGS